MPARRKSNLWLFSSSSKAKGKARPSRSMMTAGQSQAAAYKAGVQSGDDGQFQSWLGFQGLTQHSSTLKDRLKREYERGVNDAIEGRAPKARTITKGSTKGTSYKGYTIRPTEDGESFVIPKLDPDSHFDSLKDAKAFLDSWKRNPSELGKVISGSKAAGRGALSFYDNVSGQIWNITGGVPRRIVGALVGAKNPSSRHEQELRKRIKLRLSQGWPLEKIGQQTVWRMYGHLYEVKDGALRVKMDEGTVEFRAPEKNVTDRALRYRANQTPPPGPKVCALCGTRKTVEVGHVNGDESNDSPENLFWTCRSCNVRAANAMRKAGIGRKTHQYNPASEGAKTARQWVVAVMAMKGESDAMSVADAVEMVHATKPEKRSEFAREIWGSRREHGTEHMTGKSRGGGDMPDWVSNPQVASYSDSPDMEVRLRQAARPRGGYQSEWSPWMYFDSIQSSNGHLADMQKTADFRRVRFRWEVQRKERGGWTHFDSDKGDIKPSPKRPRANPGNPQSAAAEMYESFHGKKAEGETIVEEEFHEHEHLATLGVLVNFKVATLSGFDMTVGTEDADARQEDFDETAAGADAIFLTSTEDGTQLYFKGGDQSFPLDRCKMGPGTDWYRDDMIVGILYEITYRTKKKFDKFKLTDYYHNLGEETGDQPMLRYDPLSPHLYVSGGKYKIKMPLVGMSPGIEN